MIKGYNSWFDPMYHECAIINHVSVAILADLNLAFSQKSKMAKKKLKQNI